MCSWPPILYQDHVYLPGSICIKLDDGEAFFSVLHTPSQSRSIFFCLLFHDHIHVDIDAVTMTDTTSFPRGRSATTTETTESSKAGERSNINNASTINKKKRDKPAIENDILFGQKSHGTTTAEAKNSRKKRKTTTSNSESATSMLPLGGGGVVAPNQKQKEALIESISFQKLAKGTKLLGIVREINDKFALVSLPNLLTGYIIPKDVSHRSVGRRYFTISVKHNTHPDHLSIS